MNNRKQAGLRVQTALKAGFSMSSGGDRPSES